MFIISVELQTINETLANHINILDFHEDKIFFEDGSACIVLELKQIYDEILDFNNFKTLKHKLTAFLNSLDLDLTAQFTFRKHRNFEDIKKRHIKLNRTDIPLITELFKRRADKIETDAKYKDIFKYELYLIFKKKFNFNLDNFKDIFKNKKGLDHEAKNKLKNIVKELNEIKAKYINSLLKTRFIIKEIKEKELINLIGSFINFDTYFNLDDFKTKYDLIKSDFRKTPNYLYINNKYIRYITLSQMPETVIPTIIKYITNADLKFDYNLTLNLKRLDSTSEKNKLKRQKKLYRALKLNLSGNDVDEEKNFQEQNVRNLLTEMVTGSENLFNVEFLIAIQANTLEELDANCDQTLNSIRNMEGASGFKENFANFKLYLSSIPGNDMNLNNSKDFKLKTSYLTDMLPIFGPPHSIGEPMMLFRNKYMSITHLNPLSNHFIAKNGLIIGSTGSGKSFLMNNISMGYLGVNPIIMIVDKGGSFKKFVIMLGGDYFEVDANKYSINPFYVKSKNKELFWKKVLGTMIKDTENKVCKDKQIIIDELIAKVNKDNIEIPTISNFVEIADNLEFESQVMKEKKEEVHRHLRRFTKGIYGKFLDNEKGNLDVSSDIMALDLKGLEEFPELSEIFMYYISNICWYKAELDRDRTKLFVFDEVWDLLMNSDIGAQLLMEMYRTLRKYGASIYAISQAISDFAGSKYSAGIMSNVAFSYVLKQSDSADFNLLMEMLSLNEEDIRNIKNLRSVKGKFSEMLLKAQESSFIARVIPSRFEYWIATTDSEDISIYNKTLEAFNGDVLKSVSFLADYCPQGSITYPQEEFLDVLNSCNNNIVECVSTLYEKYFN